MNGAYVGQLETGSVHAGYKVLGLLGRGGMAEVYLAQRPGTADPPVVIKMLKAEHAADQSFHRMFLREATVARMIKHPNVVRVLDLATINHSQALIIEFIDGRNLGQMSRACYEKRRYLPYGALARIVVHTLEALEHIHALKDPTGRHLKLVHRDISPENVLVTYDGHVKLVDFGIAKARHAALGAAKTEAGTVRGKARYVAPEAVVGLGLDARSDLFSVGVILYELMTYTRPFQGTTDMELLTALVEHPIVPPSTFNAQIPPRLEKICLRALEKDPDHRWQSAAALRQELEAWAVDEGGAVDLAGTMDRLFPPSVDEERLRLAELLGQAIREPTVELEESTVTGMNVGLLAEALLDDDNDDPDSAELADED